MLGGLSYWKGRVECVEGRERVECVGEEEGECAGGRKRDGGVCWVKGMVECWGKGRVEFVGGREGRSVLEGM